MSSLAPVLGDRFSHGARTWEVTAFVRDLDGTLVSFRLRWYHEAEGRLRGGSRLVSADGLIFGKWQYIGAFARPVGYTLHKVGSTYYFKAPGGNVTGPPAGSRWTEIAALAAAREDFVSTAKCAPGPTHPL